MLKRGRGRPPHPDILTPAEWRVLREIRTGATNAEIAVRLGLSLATVKFHIRNIRNKLDLTERAELVAWRGEPQPASQRAARRWMLAPIGLLVGFWKPVLAGAAITVVGGGAVAAGFLAYLIVNDGEPAASPGDEPASAATVSPTPTVAEATAPPAGPSPGGTTTPAPADTPAATATSTPVPTPEPTTEATPTPAATGVPVATPTPEAREEGDPIVTFWGDVPDEERDTLRARVTDVIQFFDERFGIHVPNLPIHIAADDDAWATALGGPVEPVDQIHKAAYRNGALFVQATRTFDWIERFYFEAFQEQAAEGRDLGPEWLSEGAAMYTAHLFRHWRGEKTLGDALALVTWAASFDSTPLEDLERQSPTAAELTGVETASTATLAAEWLVSRAGEAALVAYYESLPNSESWEEAFEDAFGLSPGDAYEGIAAHRATVLVVRRSVSGSIRGPDDNPVDATRLSVYAVRVDGSGSEGVTVARNARFTIRPPDSTYRLQVTRYCPPESVELGWYEEESGFTREESEATRIVVDGRDLSGIVIRLPGTVRELVPECFGEGES
ncbi:MAG: helix-turn-helix transcriptional regulator [Chloroflexi bacterium]|nr:helix-turn-helix transcriptional regulator [Chloroflexota bacterium]